VKPRLHVLSELYYPDDSATGYILTRIAEGLALSYDVHVLSGYGTARTGAVQLPARERRNGVLIDRCSSTLFNKNVVVLRTLNLLTISLSIFWQSIRTVRHGDVVLVVTNPPSLPFAAFLAVRLRRARCVLLIHDVYPEVLFATGLLRPGSWMAAILGWLNKRLCRRVERIVVLGRDMKRLIDRKLGANVGGTTIITNWADADVISPTPRNANRLLEKTSLQEKFVVQYSGNMGRTHGLEVILDVAARLEEEPLFHFLLIGSGAKLKGVEASLSVSRLNNVTILPPQSREELVDTLNACDVAIISFIPGIAGISVPSRMYNVMAAGKPIIAVADDDSELGIVVREEKIGWVVPPNDTMALLATIRNAQAKSKELNEMGRRARAVALKYSLERVLRSYQELLESLVNDGLASRQTDVGQMDHV